MGKEEDNSRRCSINLLLPTAFRQPPDTSRNALAVASLEKSPLECQLVIKVSTGALLSIAKQVSHPKPTTARVPPSRAGVGDELGSRASHSRTPIVSHRLYWNSLRKVFIYSNLFVIARLTSSMFWGESREMQLELGEWRIE